MKKPEKELGYYMGWFVAYLLAAGFTLYFLWLGKPVSWCSGADDEHCFREWVSALSGWVAIPAAWATLIFLSKQIRNAERHHQNTMELSIAPKRFLCEQALTEHSAIQETIENYFINKERTKNNAERIRNAKTISETMAINSRNIIFSRFENEIGHIGIKGAEIFFNKTKEKTEKLEEFLSNNMETNHINEIEDEIIDINENYINHFMGIIDTLKLISVNYLTGYNEQN